MKLPVGHDVLITWAHVDAEDNEQWQWYRLLAVTNGWLHIQGRRHGKDKYTGGPAWVPASAVAWLEVDPGDKP